MSSQISEQNALDYEILIYRMYEAGYYLARAMAAVFGARSFSPTRYQTVEERVANAKNSRDYESLSLEFLLRGQPGDALKFLETASSQEIGSIPRRVIRLKDKDEIAFVLHRLIMEKFDKAQTVLKASLDDIDRLRALTGYVPLRTYICDAAP